MQWGILIPVVAILIGPIAWVANNWVRARHGYEPDAGQNNNGLRKQIAALEQQNRVLGQAVERLEDRLATVETIVTDEGVRLAREIDNLQLTRS